MCLALQSIRFNKYCLTCFNNRLTLRIKYYLLTYLLRRCSDLLNQAQYHVQHARRIDEQEKEIRKRQDEERELFKKKTEEDEV